MSVTAVIWIAVILIAVFTFWFFYAKIGLFIRRNFGSKENLRALIREGEDDTRRKSLPGATDLVLPRIRADFPEFHWPEFREKAEKQIRAWLTDQGCTQIAVHRTVLNDYKKERGNCYAVLYSAVQYTKNEKKVQSRCSVTMGYVQDPDKAGYDNGVGLICPGCGAPVTNLGEKKCRYCGTPIEEINIRIWRAVRVAEE